MESNIFKNLSEQMEGVEVLTNEKDELKEKFDKEHCGNFTGSGLKKLMSCERAVSKIEWGRPEKCLSFGVTAKKYIFSKAMERKTGIVIDSPEIIQFKYGHRVEPILIEMLKERYPDKKFSPVGFTIIEPFLGATPDGILDYPCEFKGAMNFETLYDRTEEPMDQKHTDFWQVQTEMMAMNAKKLYYVTGHPPKDPYSVVNCEDDNEVREMIREISVSIIESSPIHQQAIIDRCRIANKAIEYWFTGMTITDSLLKAGSEYVFEN